MGNIYIFEIGYCNAYTRIQIIIGSHVITYESCMSTVNAEGFSVLARLLFLICHDQTYSLGNVMVHLVLSCWAYVLPMKILGFVLR